MILLVTGGRHYGNAAAFCRTLDRIHDRYTITTIVHGDCPTGADAMVKHWRLHIQGTARDTPIIVRPYPAQWDRYPDTAGSLRNSYMVGLRPDRYVAFPGGIGTADCVSKCARAGIPGERVES